MAEVVAKWVDGVRFVHTGTGSQTVVTDGPVDSGGKGEGFKPAELLLASLAGCSGYDVADILAKQRQKLTGLMINVKASQAADPPWTFERFEIEYAFRGKDLNETLLQRAIELSKTKYCSVAATISGKAEVITRFTVEQE
jgi:putative redox protein